RAAFATKNLWVTSYAPDEIHAAGAYPNQSAGGDGLPQWTSADRSLVSTDVLLWHSFGVTHIPRPEDWPVMPVEYAGFSLVPFGFFDQNPALDVPPPKHCHDGYRACTSSSPARRRGSAPAWRAGSPRTATPSASAPAARTC